MVTAVWLFTPTSQEADRRYGAPSLSFKKGQESKTKAGKVFVRRKK
jgi:hypothetical protein